MAKMATLTRELAPGAEGLAEAVELLIADGDGEEVALVLLLADNIEAAGQFLAAIGERLFQLQDHHAAEFLAVGGGEAHPLHEDGADGKREADGGALRDGGGGLLHGPGDAGGLALGDAADAPAIRGRHDGDQAGPWPGP